ncbi:efflux RND transporter periplasmic adaptor subunit [Qipengyuania sp. GH1]|uniref:efflux RND transporter periplasmic adaptor subunit n=1 Tax=Qipengyuania aestuarii TaxID=2867241 RepID=UPI001C86DD7B|nr:efflux RND transporter periplasmic adaptor subunit [Qipengyuania aestuarii]MBX7535116.1 efflux RND transporter periplasmic adaptor subunit [Qipengyuania aestuarii]
MFDTPFDRRADEAAEERRAQHISEILDEPEQDDEDRSDSPVARPRPKRRWLAFALIVAGLGGAWWLTGNEPVATAAAGPPAVTAAHPLQKEITEWDEFVGRFQASRSVEVRPQVTGEITRIHFIDGQFVQQGAPLFTIDSRAYRAALAEAKAEVARADSALALSRDNLARAQRLISDDAIAGTEIDRLQAQVRNDAAILAAAKARVSARALDVGFTTVRAPISGRISDRRIDAGNLVSGGGGSAATLLTTINAVDPVYFEFTGSEALFLKARREGLDKGTPVEIRLQDETDYRWLGTLDFTDNGLDSQSGTIRARAVVRNGEGFLAPGLFGRMRLAASGTHQALLVPDTAIVTDQTRKLVLVVQKDGTVANRPVELGPLVGGLRVIEKGLKPNDRVIIKGTQMAMPGQKVTAQNGRIVASAPAGDKAREAPMATPASSASLAS